MQAFPTLVELFGRLTGIRDPSVPLPIDSPLSGGKTPPPVLAYEPRQVVVELPPVAAVPPGQFIDGFDDPQPLDVAFADEGASVYLPAAYLDSAGHVHGKSLRRMSLPNAEARRLMETLLYHYGLPADFHG